MVFDRKITLLQFSEVAADCWQWTLRKTLWAHVEHTGKTNYFSRLGLSAKTALFTLPRTSGLDTHSAIGWKGQHYAVTDCNRDGPLFLTVTAAAVTPRLCRVERRSEHAGADKRPVWTPAQALTFPAVLTEKYHGFEQREPMAGTTVTFVLVTPKAILLRPGELVEIADARYAVRVCHTLDDTQNEYEITRKEDV